MLRGDETVPASHAVTVNESFMLLKKTMVNGRRHWLLVELLSKTCFVIRVGGYSQGTD